MYVDTRSNRKRYLDRWSALKNERASWIPVWRDCADYILPMRSRFLASERNKGDRRNTFIINGKPTWAVGVLASGMMAGITSPARAWFRLTTPDPALAEFAAVKTWLRFVEDRIRQAMHRSNVYTSLHKAYGDLIVPGTAAMHVEEDPETLFRTYVFPTATYCLANSPRLAVDTIYRETSMTIGQMARKFRRERMCRTSRALLAQGQLDKWVELVHAIEPNDAYDPKLAGPAGMKWKSCWLEVNAGDDEGELHTGGFNEFPVMAPRWDVNGEDVYGTSPGVEGLGDAKALQTLEKKKGQAIAKVVDPPMRGPPNLQAQHASLLPGSVTAVDSLHQGQTYTPAMTIEHGAITAIAMEIREHEGRFASAVKADLWLMLAQRGASGSDPERTAREVAELHEEKMLQLGPVMERLDGELLGPLIDRVFNILQRAGYLPPPPEELQGQELRVEYISVVAQAQKLLNLSSVERLLGVVGNIAAAVPDALDKINTDQIIDECADILGVPPELVRSDEEVVAIREQRAQAKAAMAQQEAAVQTVEAGKVLSETDLDSDKALGRLLNNVGSLPAALAGMRRR